jgi:tetratricopeptide (TPR) repeat protein
MRALESSLAAGVPWRTAWPRTRAGLDETRLAETLHRWLLVGALPTEFRRYPPPTLSSEERPLAPWEVHLALAELWQVGAGPPGPEERLTRHRTELEAAWRLAPEEALPQVLLADLEPDPVARRTAAEALVARFPRSPEAAVLLARILRDEGGPLEGREEATRHAVALAPDDVDALTAYALEQARLGRYPSALESARQAVQLAPWNPTVFTTLAGVLARVDRCPEALATFQRGIDVLPDRASQTDLAALLRERSRLESSCTAGP